MYGAHRQGQRRVAAQRPLILSLGATSLRQLGRSPIKGDHLWWAGFVGELVLHAVGLHPFILSAAAVTFGQLGNWTAITEWGRQLWPKAAVAVCAVRTVECSI